MAFNYSTLISNCDDMKDTSETFSNNCNGMDTLVDEEVCNDKTWFGASAKRFKSSWETFSSDFPSMKRAFDQQVDTLKSAIEGYSQAEN